MKQLQKPILPFIICAFLAATPLWAVDGEEVVIELKTNDFELAATDISELAIGESKTIETDSGRIIDILRTDAGADIYIDGELIEINTAHSNTHQVHRIEKHVEVICDDEENCEEEIIVLTDGEPVEFGLAGSEGDRIFIHKEIEHSCTGDDENTSCGDPAAWMNEDGDTDLEELHHLQAGEKAHKIIVIKKEVITED